MASAGFVEEMMREQSLLEATCGDLFDHIEDLLDSPKEESAADVLLLDAPAPGSPLSARIIDVGGNAPAAPALEPLMALPPPAAQEDDAAFFAAAGAPVFDAKDVGGHIGSVSPHSLPETLPPVSVAGRGRVPFGSSAYGHQGACVHYDEPSAHRRTVAVACESVTTARTALVGRATHFLQFFFLLIIRLLDFS